MTTIADRQDAVNVAANPEAGGESGRRGRTKAGDAFTAVVIRLIRLQGFLADAGDELARPAGQTSARWQVLAAVEDGPASVADIARMLTLTRQSVQRIADLLADEGLVRYAENPRHRRAKLVVLQPAGRDALTTIQRRQRGWADAIGADLGAADLKALTAQLDRVLDAVGRHPVGGDTRRR